MTGTPRTTEGTLLGGRVLYRQFADGYRTGIEPVLLAAAIPAAAGDRVVEAGTGAGAALLCLSSRVSGLTGTGLELGGALADLARANLDDNGLTGIHVERTDLAAWQSDGAYDHAFANPPWHGAESSASPDPARDRARRAHPDLLTTWITAMARALRRGGTLSMILPAASTAQAAAAMVAAGVPELTLRPLWPRAGAPAKLIILQGPKSGRGPSQILPGLILHQPDGSYTPEAESILRQGKGF